MKFKSDTDFTGFLRRVKLCAGDVLFATEEGDRLNLKSALSQYIFLSATENPEIPAQGSVFCAVDSDAALLRDYLEDT